MKIMNKKKLKWMDPKMRIKKTKVKKWIIIAVVLLLTAIGVVIGLFLHDVQDSTKDIGKYEKYLGAEGKFKEHSNRYNDIFPDVIPKSAKVERFCYDYYNLWEPCYLGYLVYTCNDEEYRTEYDRLKKIDSTENKYIDGAISFPYELCAVYADNNNGYIYAVTDNNNKRFIYIELQYHDHFTDIDYEKIIDAKYLPTGFSAKIK